MIQLEFSKSLKNYLSDDHLILQHWKEIETKYLEAGRHYHNLSHLNSLLDVLKPIQNQFTSWDVLVMAIAYHDVVYNTLKQNNEEKSAALAVKRLTESGFPKNQVSACEEFILATKRHEERSREINLFTDADLAILGAEKITYQQYTEQIRKEYAFYPDLIYKPGRKKVLNHFLQMDRIYKSAAFFEQYETQARINLQAELDSLD